MLIILGPESASGTFYASSLSLLEVLSSFLKTVIMSVKGSQETTVMIDLVVLIILGLESASGTFYASSLSRF